MKNLTTSLLTIAIFASMSANAAYVIRMPLEQSLGGSLPNHSIKLGGVVEVPEIEKTPAEICDEKADAAKNFLTANYSDASYQSHAYGEYWSGFPTPALKNGCQIIFNSPAKKGFTCSGDNTYVEQIANSLSGMGFDTAQASYYGTCS